MNKVLCSLLLLLFSATVQAAVLHVSDVGSYNTTSTCTSGSLTPTSGNDLIDVIATFTTSATFSSVSDSHGATVTTDRVFAVDSTNNIGFAAFRVHNVTDGLAHTISVVFTGSVNCYSWLVQASGVGLYDSSQTTVASGSSTDFKTNSLVPSANGALLLAWGGANSARTLGTWQSSYTGFNQSRTSGPTALGAWLAQATSASTQGENTPLSSSVAWSGLIVSYIPPPPPVTTGFVISNGHALISNGKPVVVN